MDKRTSNEEESSDQLVNITVKFKGGSIPISISLDSTVNDLKSVLQPLTNVLPRGQNLICKGKKLVDNMTLRQSQIGNGAKMMLVASHGLHQGDGPILKEASARPRVRSTSLMSDEKHQEKLIGIYDRNGKVAIWKTTIDRWKATGVIALSDCKLKEIPGEVWTCGQTVRMLDISNNILQGFSVQIGLFSQMQKLFLNGNNLSDESICWDGLKSLKHLQVLSLNSNNLAVLPPELGALCSLRNLDVSSNKLMSLPIEIAHLTELEVLKANNNRLTAIPACIGNCKALVEVDLSSNLLSELPDTLASLHNLKALHLSNNGLKSLPSAIFKMCLQLSTIDLHNTEITMDLLRQLEGWEDFDERRRSKHQKQLDFRVFNRGEFDEGADEI